MHSEPSDATLATRIVYSVVVPVYRNEDTLERVVGRLAVVAERLDGRLEVVFVVDGSPDGSLELLRAILPTAAIDSQVITHSRNFGAFQAIRTGIAAARGSYVGVMAADLQEPPELMEDFFRLLRSGDVDIVVGRRASRQDQAFSAAASRTFWWLYRGLINRDIPRGGVDVFGCTRAVAAQLVDLRESHSSLVALLYWVGFRRAEVPYVRVARESGKSAWTLRKRVRYLLDSVFSFTNIPISLLTAAGVVGAVLTTAWAVTVFVGWATGRIDNPGYTPLMLVMLASTFTILIGLGIVGSYVWRTFENSKNRPPSLEMTSEVFHDE